MLIYRVAGFGFGVETYREREMYCRMENYLPFEVRGEEDTPRDLLFVLELDEVIKMPDDRPLKVFDYLISEDKARLSIYPSRYLLRIDTAEGNSFMLECPRDASGTDSFPLACRCDITRQGIAPPRHVLDHFLVFAFSLATVSKGTLLLHASTVVFESKAVLFLAESGTGKSTHTRLWRENIPGSFLLNDDAPAVRLVEGKAVAYGTPWSGKTPCYRNEHYPVAAFVRIRRAPYNEIEKQPPLAAFGALFPSSLPTLQQQESEMDALCESLSGMVDAAPVYVLDCLPDAQAALVSKGAVFQ